MSSIEWNVTIPEMSSRPEPDNLRKIYTGFSGFVSSMSLYIFGILSKFFGLVVSKPRNVMHGIKVGLALSIVSLFYYIRPLYDGIGGSGIGAVMTVAAIYDFTVGATIYKAFNRVTATILAGSLAIGIHYIADSFNQTTDPVIRGVFVFLISLVATFARLIPAVRREYDYGMMTFVATFSMVSVSGYRVEQLIPLWQHRCLTVALGSSICVLVCMFLNPIWAGHDLHLFCVKNMEKLAKSLDECVGEYFDGKVEGSQGSVDGYKSVLNSKASEDSLANLARWEPPHGQFQLQHPWHKYLNISASMRRCASCVDALYSHINSEIQTQAPEHMKKHLGFAFLKLSSQSSCVLTELANSIKFLTKSRGVDTLIKDMGLALGELQIVLKSFPNHVIARSSENKADLQLVEVMPIVTVASLLFEISSRIVVVVDAVNDLADEAFYEPAIKGEKTVQVQKV